MRECKREREKERREGYKGREKRERGNIKQERDRQTNRGRR
jgi:hypothetical protein